MCQASLGYVRGFVSKKRVGKEKDERKEGIDEEGMERGEKGEGERKKERNDF